MTARRVAALVLSIGHGVSRWVHAIHWNASPYFIFCYLCNAFLVVGYRDACFLILVWHFDWILGIFAKRRQKLSEAALFNSQKSYWASQDGSPRVIAFIQHNYRALLTLCQTLDLTKAPQLHKSTTKPSTSLGFQTLTRGCNSRCLHYPAHLTFFEGVADTRNLLSANFSFDLSTLAGLQSIFLRSDFFNRVPVVRLNRFSSKIFKFFEVVFSEGMRPFVGWDLRLLKQVANLYSF